MHHDNLFELLIEKKVHAVVLRALLDTYQRQTMRTVWNGFSSQFSTSNRLRQRGVISPILFCVYMDALLKRLEAEGFGCWIGSVGYADDLKLLSPSAHGLWRMTKICEEFGIDYGVQYNTNKTVCILYARKTPKGKPNWY